LKTLPEPVLCGQTVQDSNQSASQRRPNGGVGASERADWQVGSGAPVRPAPITQNFWSGASS
jgi:hypothetical protein